jgi:trk system potassium uptake protein TrkH
MNLFDSLCHTFGTMATGGFSTKGSSIGHFKSVYFDTIITIFMLIAGTNFSLHYRFLQGNFKSFWKNSEFRFFILVATLATALVTANLRINLLGSLGQSFRYASFQVASILTTTGYTTADFEKWPYFSQIILFLLMFIGGSAGSTGGGMKCLRILLLIKQGYRELYRHIHPHAVVSIKLGKQVVPSEIMESIWGFFLLYLLLFIFATLVMVLLGLDFIGALTSVAASLGNIGPGFGSVGPVDNYQHIPFLGKWALIFCMLLGRLEIYTIIILLIPEFWRK